MLASFLFLWHNMRSMNVGKKSESTKVLVAMSGGVDSSVAAVLLKERGYFVVGVFMKFWSEARCAGAEKAVENRCCSGDAYEAAKSVCAKLDIPFQALDVQKEFKKEVVDYFLREYRAGRTPNPCVRCNEEIKFKLLLETAKKWGMDYISTGHYARKREFRIKNPELRTHIFKLLAARDKEKDQSYFLYNLTQEQLRRILFPIGGYAKGEVRKLARKWGLPAAGRPESFEVCFVPDRKTADFLARHVKTKPGKIVDEKGRKLGEHRGLPFYTIGQRRGINIGGPGPYYVAAKNPTKNELVVTDNPRSPLLSQRELIAEKVNWISGAAPKLPLKIKARIRYRQSLQEAKISKTIIHNSQFLIQFKKPQKAITPGQSVVFYDGQEVLGGGVIY